MERKELLKKVSKKLKMSANGESVAKLIQNSLINLNNVLQRYPTLKTNLGDIEKDVKEQVVLQLGPQDIYKKMVFGQTVPETKDNRKKREFKEIFKTWLHNLIDNLNKEKKKNKWLNVKKLVEPFTKLEFIDG